MTYTLACDVGAYVLTGQIARRASSAYCSIPTASIWFPVAPGVTTLPAAPAEVVNPAPAAANQATLPPDWDDAAPDLCYLFQDILPTDQGPVFPSELTPDYVLEPFNETVILLGITRAVLAVADVPYSLNLGTTEVVAVTRTSVAVIVAILSADAAAYAVTGQDAILTASLQPVTGSYVITGQDAAFSVVTPVEPLLLMHMEGTGQTFTDSSTYNRTITVLNYFSDTDPTQSTAQAKFGSKSAYFESGVRSFYVNDLGLGTASAYTVELFFRFSSSWSGGSSGSSTLILWNSTDGGGTVYYDRTQGLWMALNTQTAQTYIGTLAADTWHYIKWTRATTGTLRRFLNGSEVYTSQTYTNTASLGNAGIGYDTGGEADNSWKGYVDEYRILPIVDNSLGVPTEAFPDP